MRHDQKPHNKRKIFKRKHGGPKFTLNGGFAKATFSRADMQGTWANLKRGQHD